MDRRVATAWLASLVASACGGGGGGGAEGAAGITPPPAPAPTPAPTPAAGLSADIAAWGDSLTVPFAANLQVLFPARAVFNGGIPGQTSPQVRERMVADTGRHSWVSVFWFGHNNSDAPSQIKADMVACVAALVPGNSRFIVMSLLTQTVPTQYKGTAEYQNRLQISADLAAAYPQNYLDIRSYLISQYNPSLPQDVADFNNDVVPTSLLHDESHLNNDGSVLVARKVQEFINARGW